MPAPPSSRVVVGAGVLRPQFARRSGGYVAAVPTPLTHRTTAIHRRYANGEQRPLRGYLVLAAGYAAGAGSLLVLSRRRSGADRDRLGWGDLALTAVSTYRLSRILTKDAIASPLRAPVTRYAGPGQPAEVSEEVAPQVKNHQVLHALGELLTCPFCLGQWIATSLVAGHVLAPGATRMVTSVLTAAAGADVLHYGHVALQRLAPPPVSPPAVPSP